MTPDKRDSGKWDPDWCISPGETLRDWMDEMHLSPRVMAGACGTTPEVINGVLTGKRKITPTIGRHLEVGTGIPKSLWLNLERAYRDGLKRGKIDASSHAR